jgi:membrane-bound lytic murein transglycosylase B
MIVLSGLVPAAGVVAAIGSASPAGAAPLAHEIHTDRSDLRGMPIDLSTGSADTGSAGTGSADTGSADTGSGGTGSASGSAGGGDGVPVIAGVAYRAASMELAVEQPQCGMSWELLAGIGRVESHHANDGDVDIFGTTRHAIYGPALDGTLAGNEVVADGAGGYQRAEGPMQFMPGTWAHYARPGANPQNLFDSAYAAGSYLCSGGLNMRDPAQRTAAILRYNHSMAYVATVMSWARSYQSGN